ncbi:MAG: hypothetical protein AAB308_08145 [Nitrospirota bacterium]
MNRLLESLQVRDQPSREDEEAHHQPDVDQVHREILYRQSVYLPRRKDGVKMVVSIVKKRSKLVQDSEVLVKVYWR